jgi:hypothetical protein
MFSELSWMKFHFVTQILWVFISMWIKEQKMDNSPTSVVYDFLQQSELIQFELCIF